MDYLFLYPNRNGGRKEDRDRLNPYFIGLPILIGVKLINFPSATSLNPYFIGLPILINIRKSSRNIVATVSILILLDYLFLLSYANNN